MYCTKCGKQINDGATFCKFCGNKIKPEDSVTPATVGTVTEKNAVSQPQSQNWNNMQQSQKTVSLKINKKFFIIAAIVAIIAVAGVTGYKVYEYMQRNIDLEKYVKVQIDGYEENGTAYAYVDEDKLIEKIAKIKKVDLADKNKNHDKYIDQCDDMNVNEILSLIKLKVNKKEKLKNGDTVKATIKYSESKGKKYGVNLKGKEVSKKVSKLSKYKDYNPFDNIKVSFTGTAPFAKVTWEYVGDDSRFSSSNYSTKNDDYLDEGDVITINFDLKGVELEADGYQVSKWSKKYKCRKVDKYVYRESDIPEEGLTKMKKDASDIIDSYFADGYEYIGYSDLKYVGSYVLTSKDEDSYDFGNIVYLIYSAQVSSKEVVDNYYVYQEDVFTTQNVYFPIKMYNVISKKNGSVSYDYYEYIIGDTNLHYDRGWSNVSGYTDGTKMYNDLVGTQKKYYYYEVSDSLSQFGASNAKPGAEKKQETTTTGESATIVGTDADYILPNSSSAYISESELTGLSKEQLRIATNELYARHGYIFNDEGLLNYFKGKSWYKPTVKSEDFSESIFNEYEKANKDELVKYQQKMGYR